MLNTQSCGLSRYQSRKTCQTLDYYTGDSSSNGDEQWERTRAMAKYSTDCDSSEEEDDLEYYDSSSDESGGSVNHQNTSEEEDVFSLSLETQIPLKSMTFSRLGNPWGYQ